MANSASSSESTLQNNGGSPQPDASSAESKSLRNSNIPPGVGAPPNAGGASADEKAQDKQVGFFLLTLLIVVILLLSQSEPWGTWIAVIVGVIALALIVQILGRRLSAQRFWGLLVISAALVYAASLAYQAGAPARALRQQNSTAIPITVNATPVALVISYSEQAPLEKVDQPGLPLFVYIQAATATSTSTPTSAPMPTLTATAASAAPTSIVATGVLTNAPTSTSTATSTATPTPTPTATATATPAAVISATGNISFTLAFLPQSEGLVFSDQTGGPVVPQIVVEGSDGGTQNAALYVRRSSANTDASRVNVNMALRTNGQTAYGQPLGVIDISPESTYAAWWRNFWGLLLGPATPILALVATLLGFGWQWWEGERKKWEERSAEINQVTIDLTTSVVAGVRKYDEIKRRAESQRWSSDLMEQLERSRQSILALDWEQQLFFEETVSLLQREGVGSARNLKKAVVEILKPANKQLPLLLRAINLVIDYSESKAAGGEYAPKDTTNVVTCAFETIRRYGIAAEEICLEILFSLKEEPEAQTKILDNLEDSVRHAPELLRKPRFGQMLDEWEKRTDAIGSRAKSLQIVRNKTLAWLRPHLWRANRLGDSPAVSLWLEANSLDFNPFGPEYAQQDQKLPDYVVRSVFKEVAGRHPVLVLAAPGAGRSAAAMILANDCIELPQGSRDKRAFPVYCAPTVRGLIKTSERSYLRLISEATCQWLCRLVAQMPETFLELSDSRKACLVQLLRESLGPWPLIEHALRQASPDGRVDRLLREMQPFARGDVNSLCFTPEVWADLLKCSLAKGYEWVEVFFDVPTPESQEQSAAIANGLAPLLDLVIPLSSQGIFLKLFLPNLFDLTPPPGCEIITISWTEQWLKDMLEGRIRTKDDGFVPFNELFDLGITGGTGGDPADLLVKAAVVRKDADAPRYLIRLGNALLRKHTGDRAHEKIPLSTLKGVIEELQ